MEYTKADTIDIEEIYSLIQDTIDQVYPKYYPDEVVRFFRQFHSMENIERDIREERVFMLTLDHQVIGTGSYEGNHITRVFVDSEYQGRGCGSFIMQKLEDRIAREYGTVHLEASFPAVRMYEKRGYKTVRHERWTVKNGAVMICPVMEKCL